MSRSKRLILVGLLCVAAFAVAGVALARTPEPDPAAITSAPAGRATPTPKAYPKLEASFSIYNWRKSDTPRDMIGTMTVHATGGNGHYTYEFIGLHYTNTFDFRWRAGRDRFHFGTTSISFRPRPGGATLSEPFRR